MAYNSLKAFKGNKFIYIGECKTDVNASNEFFLELKNNWKLTKVIEIPHFIGVNDSIFFFIR